MATALTFRPNRAIAGSGRHTPIYFRRLGLESIVNTRFGPRRRRGILFSGRLLSAPMRAGSRANDSTPFEMSVENARNVLGLSDEASFDDILRAKNLIIVSCKDDQRAISQVEAAYDMLLMQSLAQGRAGKAVNSSVRYADVKPVKLS
ncbi:hypothetical protein OROMI_033162 [Orobanche minor]